MKAKVKKRVVLPSLLAIMLIASIFCFMVLSSSATENANSDELIEEKYTAFSQEYPNAQTHPLVAFVKKGEGYNLVGAYAKLEDAYNGIKTSLGSYNSENIVIAFRTDALSTASADVFNGFTGSLKLDLFGNTLTQNGSGFIYKMFRNVASSKNPDIRLSFSIENGSVVAATEKPLFALSYGANCTNDLQVDFEFNKVTFILQNTSATLFANWENGYTSVPESFSFNIFAKFNDCIFDSSYGAKMFSLGGNNNYDRNVYDVEINGGSIIAGSSFANWNFMTLNNNDNGRADVIKFGKSKITGNQTTLVMPKSVEPRNDAYLGVNGEEYRFVKISQTDATDTYILRPVATMGIDFAPKMSITLDRNLVMNVYVPATNILNSFSVDGENYEVSEFGSLKPAVIDGKSYYLINIPLAAKEAARDVKLIAKVSVGERIATATFTFSIPKYAELVAIDTDALEVELILDVISYVRAAYDYFGTADDEAVSKMDRLLGKYYDENNKPTFEGQTESTVTGFKSVTYVLKETAAMRFYLNNGASASDYKFYIGGKLVSVEEGSNENGAYVDVDVYAYEACETVSVKCGDTDVGSFHINAYYTFVSGDKYTGENKEKLVALTERFWKYCQSAKAYRESALSVKHSYVGTTVPPTCDTQGYTVYICSDCGDTYTADYVAAHGHMFGEWYVNENVSKTSNGTLRQNCSNCNKFNLQGLSVIATGNLGAGTPAKDTAIYTIYEDGTLKVTGSGETYNCNWNCANQPFKDYRDVITRVIVCDGITKLGRGSFGYLKNLEYADLSDSLTEYPANLFMDSFKVGITSYTIPANITKIQQITIGRYDQQNALFTDVYIENPNIEIVDFTNTNGTVNIFVNKSASNCKDLTLYSYGESNNVKAYADKHGFNYVDLNATFEGTIDNVTYRFSRGELTLNPTDSALPAYLPENAPWLLRVGKEEVTKLVIGSGIKEIPEGYFRGYTSLTSVSLPENLTNIGSLAFATDSECNKALTIDIKDGLSVLSNDFLRNRTNVTVNSFAGTALDGYSQSGVVVNLTKAFKLLLIGNSLSNDAADVNVNNESQLYNIIKSMVGDDVYVEIGVLYSGAKTAAWHATVAEANARGYTFYIISDDTNGVWKSNSDYTAKEGLTYDAWDVVTIQPYGNEALTGSAEAGSSSSSGEVVALEKFYPLSESLPFIIDYINTYSSNSEIYYYMTWSNSQTPELESGLWNYNKMLAVAKAAVNYTGTESGRGFDGLIPVGTAIQNARSTYLGLQYYVTDNTDDSFHFVKALQRDNVHLNVTVGRYIAGLTFAKILVPDEIKLESYTLPGIKDSKLIGALPADFTTIARLSVDKMIETLSLSGDAQYAYTAIDGYTAEPGAEIAKEVEKLTFGEISVADKAELIDTIKGVVSLALTNDARVSVRILEDMVFSDVYKNCTAEISISYGFATTKVTKTISAKLNGPTAEIVNKNGADAVVTYVVDDGNWDTARYAKQMLEAYENLTFSFAVPAKQLATLNTADVDGDGILEYVMDDGKYTYVVNQSGLDFWNGVLVQGRTEVISHTYTHGFWGTNDDGGVFVYLKNGESTVTISESMPEGSSTKEIYASKQIIEEQLGSYLRNGKVITLIDPGIGVKTIDSKDSNGELIVSYKTYFKMLWERAFNNGDLISVRGTFGSTYDPSLDFATKVVTPERYDTYEERMNTPAYMIVSGNANPKGDGSDDISNWTDYIDSAIELNGWACFCIHVMNASSGHYITAAQAEKLFAYTNSKNVWVATYTEASLYYSEWSTAEVDVEFENGEIKVTLTDKERNDVYDLALTVKVSVPDTWTSVNVGGDTYNVLKDENGASYVLVDIVPDSGTVTVTEAN